MMRQCPSAWGLITCGSGRSQSGRIARIGKEPKMGRDEVKRIALAASIACWWVNAAAGISAAPLPNMAAERLLQTSDRPWLDPRLSPEVRAHAALAAMTLDEKLRLIFGFSDEAVNQVSKGSADIVSGGLQSYLVLRAIK